MKLESANVSGIRKICKRNPQTVKEFRKLFNTELAYAHAEYKNKDLTIVISANRKSSDCSQLVWTSILLNYKFCTCKIKRRGLKTESE